ncbi:Wd repeat protein, putative [Eimeria necatrix]|uniref:Wd repeat protein, putative n=1 Tax=Eimeria necatrix TaxID=51315 RepID=U6N6P2_9EIME|nr:Wd repeat protein, putative [Eimeria necatrix]CDJ70365.1 Wd repeat protein, putative [Eimeria necatrix]
MSEPKRQKGTKGKRAPEAEEEPEKELENGLEFEDPYGDDLDEEEQQQLQQLLRKQQKKQSSSSSSSSSSSKRAAAAAAEDQEDEWSDVSDAEEMQTDEDEENEQPVKVWRPGVDTLGEGEVLECDSSAYELLHRLQTAWPCLSFDFIPDQLGAARTRCPHTCYAVGGTQSDGKENCLYIMKWDRLHKTQHDDSSSLSGESGAGNTPALVNSLLTSLCNISPFFRSDEDDNGEDAKLDFRLIAHKGAVNRIRCCPQARMPRLVAAWSDLGVVGVWDIEKHLKRLDEPGAAGPPPDPHQKPTFEFKGHGTEGFAMDWNPLHGAGNTPALVNSLLTSLCNISPFFRCVEWHPSEEGVFAAASLDDSLTFWDLSVEREEPTEVQTAAVPEQLMFVHGGQQQISEFHFHPQIPGPQFVLDWFSQAKLQQQHLQQQHLQERQLQQQQLQQLQQQQLQQQQLQQLHLMFKTL